MNIKDIIPSGLYKCICPKKYYNGGLPGKDENYEFLYHCKNWTFRPRISKSGSIEMLDTYYDSYESGITLTEQNASDFELVFDFNDVEPCRVDDMDEYEEVDIYRTATNSGGYSYGGGFWKKMTAKRSSEKLLFKYEAKLASTQLAVASLEQDIERIKSGEHWKLK